MSDTGGPFAFNQFSGRTELPLPSDPTPTSPRTGRRCPLTIRRASLQDAPSTLRRIRKQPAYDLGHGVLVEPDNLSFYVSYDGNEIIVDVADELQAYAAGWVLHAGAALSTLFTRGLPLHCAGASLDGHYFGILAAAGTGKSTTLWALLQSGALFANDDLLPVFFESAAPTAYPSVSLFPKLHRASLECEGLDWTRYQVAPPNEDKFWVPIPAVQRIIEPQTLSALFLLQPAQGQGEEVRVVRASLADAAGAIRQNLHGLWLVQKYVSAARLSALVDTLAQSVPVYTLRYQKRFEVLPQMVEAIRVTLHNPAVSEDCF